MEGHYEGAPNLATILQTLASLQSGPAQQPQARDAFEASQGSAPPNVPKEPRPYIESPKLGPPARKQQDPTTIIDWSSGLKCVMKIVASQEHIIKDIRKVNNDSKQHNSRYLTHLDGRSIT